MPDRHFQSQVGSSLMMCCAELVWKVSKGTVVPLIPRGFSFSRGARDVQPFGDPQLETHKIHAEFAGHA
jgi:hypothetical protein